MGTCRLYNVALSSMQSHYVALTLMRRCLNVTCSLGIFAGSRGRYLNTRPLCSKTFYGTRQMQMHVKNMCDPSISIEMSPTWRFRNTCICFISITFASIMTFLMATTTFPVNKEHPDTNSENQLWVSNPRRSANMFSTRNEASEIRNTVVIGILSDSGNICLRETSGRCLCQKQRHTHPWLSRPSFNRPFYSRA